MPYRHDLKMRCNREKKSLVLCVNMSFFLLCRVLSLIVLSLCYPSMFLVKQDQFEREGGRFTVTVA